MRAQHSISIRIAGAQNTHDWLCHRRAPETQTPIDNKSRPEMKTKNERERENRYNRFESWFSVVINEWETRDGSTRIDIGNERKNCFMIAARWWTCMVLLAVATQSNPKQELPESHCCWGTYEMTEKKITAEKFSTQRKWNQSLILGWISKSRAFASDNFAGIARRLNEMTKWTMWPKEGQKCFDQVKITSK